MSDTESEFEPQKPSKHEVPSKKDAKSEKQELESKKKGGKAAKKEKKQKAQKQPKKKKESQTKAQAQDSEAKETVFEYMEKQNRPYNLLNIYDNLHGKIKKPVLQQVLKELEQEGKLSCKEFGKNAVYFLNQDRMSVSKEAVDQLAVKFNQLRAEEMELAQQYKKNSDQLKKLLTKKTVSEIMQTITKTTENLKKLQTKRQKLVHLGSEKIDEKEVQKIEKEEGVLRKELNKRRKLTKECLNTWSEITEKKVNEVAAMMGVEL